jgi:hypothetical protein
MLVHMVQGANAPVIEKYVKEQTEILKNGGTLTSAVKKYAFEKLTL